MRRLLVLASILAPLPAWADVGGDDAAAGPPVILRGERAKAPSPPARPVPADGPTMVRGGETLWVLDQRDGRVRACRLVNTTQVGEQRIRCSEAELR